MKHIKSLNCLQTQRKNYYIYDEELKRTHFCPPLLYHILSLTKKGEDPESWYKTIISSQEPITIDSVGTFSKAEVDYYYRKYLMFKSNGYFSDVNQEHKLCGALSPNLIKSCLANSRQITFEVTDKCNLSCKYCGYGKLYHDYDQRENKNLDIRSARRLLDYLLESWNSPLNHSHDKNIYISFYGGEPLLNFPFIEDIVHYVNQLDAKHNRFTFSITTNGLLLEKHMDFLYKNRFNILISLDGNPKNNGYRVYKNQKPAYDDIFRNVLALRKKYPDYFNSSVNFNAVLHNKNSVSDIHRYFKEQFGKSPSIGELNTGGINPSRKEEFWETYANVNESLYQSEDYSLIQRDMFLNLPNVRSILLFLHYYTDFSYYDYNRFLYPEAEGPRLPTGTCAPFSKKIFVTVNGKILPCERIGQQFHMGHVSPEKVELDFQNIADKLNDYFNKMRKLCNRCFNAMRCTQCIFNLDTIDSENPVCRGFMSEQDYATYLSSLIGYLEEHPEVYYKMLKEVVVE